MMKLYLRFKREIQRPENRNKVLILGAFTVFAVAILITQINWQSIMPDLRNYRFITAEYNALNQELRTEKLKLFHAEQGAIGATDVWNISSNEDDRLVIMQKLETFATGSGIKLRTAGNLKNVQIVDGIVGYELDVNADPTSLNNVCQFFITLAVSQPRFYWDNLTIKPSGSNVVLSGKLKVVVVEQAALKNYWGSM